MKHFTAAFDKPQALISEEALAERNAATSGNKEIIEPSSKLECSSGELQVRLQKFPILLHMLIQCNFGAAKGNASQRSFSSTTLSAKVGSISAADHSKKRGMVLPFTPLSITFDEIGYEVDMPQVQELASNFKGTFMWIIHCQVINLKCSGISGSIRIRVCLD
jgi:hypothetical protein